MSAALFFEHPLWSRLAAMHWHFLWQGLLVACLYWAVVNLFNITSARLRYLLGMSGLAAMMLLTFATFWLAEVPEPRNEPLPQAAATLTDEASHSSLLPREKVAEGRMRGNDVPEDLHSEVPLTLALSPQGRGDKTISSSPPLTSEATSTEGQSPLVSVLLSGWFLGVMIFGLRLLGGVGTVVWWRWSSISITDTYWIELVQRLSREVGLAHPPRLAVSQRAEDAFSLGLVRPLIVLPAAWLLKLPPEALEHILAHELAHIRRFDAWANLFQRVLEAWLFYHPAVWWLSRQMDEEREKCADLKAVSLTGDRLRYVKTLAGIAEYQREARRAKSNGPILATGMGGKNMVLLERVRHILGQTPRTGAASRFLAGTMVLAIPMALWVGTMMLPVNAQEGAAVAQADREREGDKERGDRERPEGERRDGDRPRGERDGVRPRPEGERRDGDRPRPEGERRDGGRPRPEGERRDGDRPRPEGERPDGDRPRPDGPPRDGEGWPGFRPGGFGGPMPPRDRDGEGPRGFPREGLGPQAEMMLLIRELRREVEQLRHEVRELREGREVGPRPEFRRPDGEGRPPGVGPRPPSRRPGGEGADRPDARRPEGERPDGEGDRRPDARRPEGERPGDRNTERREGDDRREGNREEREVEERYREASERLEEAREAEREKRDVPKEKSKDRESKDE